MNCQEVIITDSVYEEIINDLIQAGNIALSCTHTTDHACDLCISTWSGCVQNAKAVMKGKKKAKEVPNV